MQWLCPPVTPAETQPCPPMTCQPGKMDDTIAALGIATLQAEGSQV